MTEAGPSLDPWRWLRKCEGHAGSARRMLRLDGVPPDSAAIRVQFAAENLVGAATVAGGHRPTLLPELGAQIDALPPGPPLRRRFEDLRKHDGSEWRYGCPSDDGSAIASPLAGDIEAWLDEVELLAGDFALILRDRSETGRKPA